MDRAETYRLTAAAQAGSEVAFARLVRVWHPRLLAHAWRLLGDREAATDVAQAAWLEIAKGLTRLRDPQAFPAWAFRITSRRAAAHIRGLQSARRLTRELEQAHLAEATTPPAPHRDRDDALQAAIAALPPDQRAAVALHYSEGLSVAEIAVALDAPVGTIKTRLMHARLKLKTALQGDNHD